MAEKITIEQEQIFDCRLGSNLMYLTEENQKRLKLEGTNGMVRLAFLGMVEKDETETFKPYKKE